ncbi:MAG: hypothetical protein AVDCRST_MAG89-1248, partial [uncultured Gemmatimonadetes bacterium]
DHLEDPGRVRGPARIRRRGVRRNPGRPRRKPRLGRSTLQLHQRQQRARGHLPGEGRAPFHRRGPRVGGGHPDRRSRPGPGVRHRSALRRSVRPGLGPLPRLGRGHVPGGGVVRGRPLRGGHAQPGQFHGRDAHVGVRLGRGERGGHGERGGPGAREVLGHAALLQPGGPRPAARAGDDRRHLRRRGRRVAGV